MERGHRAGVTTFFSMALNEGEVDLGEEAAHHAQVKRLAIGDAVTVTNGLGYRGTGRIATLGKRALVVTIDQIETVPSARPIHLYVPVADRDRMLWLAEKATELQVKTWTPVMYRRSKSVSPRGEGEAFDRKVHARMTAALEQSGGAWLPEIDAVREPSHIRTPDDQCGFVLERGAPSLGHSKGLRNEVSIAVGPEGGFEPDELTVLRDAGWSLASLGNVTLRFETAAMAALAVVRAADEP